MESILHIFSVEIINRFIFNTDIYTLSNLLDQCNQNQNVRDQKSLTNYGWRIKHWKKNLRTEQQRLWENWGYADIECDIIFVNKFAGFSGHLVHHSRTDRGNGSPIILTHVSRVITSRSEEMVCRIWYQPVRPKIFCSGIEICGEL